jgi:hypothetical protein
VFALDNDAVAKFGMMDFLAGFILDFGFDGLLLGDGRFAPEIWFRQPFLINLQVFIGPMVVGRTASALDRLGG